MFGDRCWTALVCAVFPSASSTITCRALRTFGCAADLLSPKLLRCAGCLALVCTRPVPSPSLPPPRSRAAAGLRVGSPLVRSVSGSGSVRFGVRGGLSGGGLAFGLARGFLSRAACVPGSWWTLVGSAGCLFCLLSVRVRWAACSLLAAPLFCCLVPLPACSVVLSRELEASVTAWLQTYVPSLCFSL